MASQERIRLLWVLSSAGEASLARPIADALRPHGIESVFVSWLSETCNAMAGAGIACRYAPDFLPAEAALDERDLDAIDGRYRPPGLASIVYSEARARYWNDGAPLVPLAARYLALWERLCDEERVDAVVMWQSTNLPCRTAWAVAHARGVPHLVFVNGPAFDRLSIADEQEEAVWSELESALREPQEPLSLGEGHAVQALVETVTHLHSAFKPRAVSLWPPFVRRLRERLKDALKRPYPPERRGAVVPSDYERLLFRDIERHLDRARFRSVWRRKLGLVRYAEADFDERYVYFPMQNQVDVKLSTRAPFYNDQVELARHIARAIPPGFTLYVKEHPNHPGSYDASLLRSLARLSNVKIVPPETDEPKLIRNARAVVVVNSTAGWEAFLWKVPVVALGRPFFALSELVYAVPSLDELPLALRRAVDGGRARYEAEHDSWECFISKTLTTTREGSAFGYMHIFGAIAPVESTSNGRAIAEALLEKLARALPGRIASPPLVPVRGD